MLRVLFVVLLLCCAAGVAAEKPQEAPPPRVIPVAELIQQLTSGTPKERDAAQNRLSTLAIDAPPELVAATKSEQAEVRQAATLTVKAMATNVAVKQLERAQRFAEQGYIDLYIAAMSKCDLPTTDSRLWETPLAFGNKMLVKCNRHPRKGPLKHEDSVRVLVACPSSYPNFEAYKKHRAPRFTQLDDVFICPDPQLEIPPRLMRYEAVHCAGLQSPQGLCASIVVSRGNVTVTRLIQESIIFANGDVVGEAGYGGSIIVADGDVTIKKKEISHLGIIVARGNIVTTDRVDQTDLIAGGQVTATQRVSVGKRPTCEFIQNEKNPLGFIKFFELTTVGVTVSVRANAVVVTRIEANSVCEQSGMQVNDTILEVNGKKPTNAESFRRLLRDKLALGDATVKIQRDKVIHAITLRLPE